MRTAFVSNYINHHQIPFCNEMYRLLEGEFTFIQTEAMEEERIRMGWHDEEQPVYVKHWYEEPEECRSLVMDCELVLFGGTDDESFIKERLKAGKPVIRISERLYKTGQWKAVSPRGLLKKYFDHTRYRNKPVYLLCAGAYVPSDFRIVRAYPGKMYCWGYFPECRQYDIEGLLAGKGWEIVFEGEHAAEGGQAEVVPYLLWAGRMINWKHPELAMETARHLKARGLHFHLEMAGDGELREQMEKLRKNYGLENQVSFAGFQPPEEVRRRMEKADIFLFTSDRQEGWGAVANEAMNSGCALVADHMIGSVPCLVEHGVNGLVYRDGCSRELLRLTEDLVRDREMCRSLGRSAYHRITEVWNAENAAESLVKLARQLFFAEGGGNYPASAESGGRSTASADDYFHGKLFPCAAAPILKERASVKDVKLF